MRVGGIVGGELRQVSHRRTRLGPTGHEVSDRSVGGGLQLRIALTVFGKLEAVTQVRVLGLESEEIT